MTASKHRVLVERFSLPGYLEKGYVESEARPRELLGVEAWAKLDKDARDKLVVVEIDEEKHRVLNAPPVAYHVKFDYRYRLSIAVPQRLDVLEKDSRDGTTICALHGVDYPSNAAQFETARLGDTPREAAELAKPDLLLAIRDLREDADRLESFLRQNEVL